MAKRKVRVMAPAWICSSATTYSGPTPETTKTYWQASLWMPGGQVASVGTNGEGRYKTQAAAERAVLKLARERLR